MLGKLSILGDEKSLEDKKQVQESYERGKVIADRRAMARARLSEANAIRSARLRGLRRNLPTESAPDIATALSGLPAALLGITSAIPSLGGGIPATARSPGRLISWLISKLVGSMKGIIFSLLRIFRLRRPFLFYGVLIVLVLIILYPILGTIRILLDLIGAFFEVLRGIVSFFFNLI